MFLDGSSSSSYYNRVLFKLCLPYMLVPYTPIQYFSLYWKNFSSSLLFSVLLFSLYGRHLQANPEPPKKSNDKSKKISRKPLTAKNKWREDRGCRWMYAQPAKLLACAFFLSLFVLNGNFISKYINKYCLVYSSLGQSWRVFVCTLNWLSISVDAKKVVA